MIRVGTPPGMPVYAGRGVWQRIRYRKEYKAKVRTMQDYFYTLADTLTSLLRGREVYTAMFHGEASDFVRFNRSAIRQPGTITQHTLRLDLIDGRRQYGESSGPVRRSGD